MPQYAARLNHNRAVYRRPPSRRPTRECSPIAQQFGGRNFNPFDSYLYTNGVINGTVDAWTINFGYAVTDTASLAANNSYVTGLSFGAWLAPGDILQSVQISITSSPFGGTIYFSGVVTVAPSGCLSNQYGFNVCTETASFAGPELNIGTYWITLQNAVVNSGDAAYWDENSGPSLAEDNSIGTIPSESFTLLGYATTTIQNTCMPQQSGGFDVIHNFTGQGDGSEPNGVALDKAGNIYGPTGYYSGNGSVYKLAQAASGWILSTLYNFLGESSGSSPSGLMVGNNGILYGAAQGGLENCNSGGYCGFIFSLRPPATACHSTSCGWNEAQTYTFTGPADAAQGGNLVSDSSGNLYGVSQSGGAQQLGAVFELSPSIGGWIESILYNFSGGSGGSGPTDIIVGRDGSLYGTTGWGGTYSYGVVFQLTLLPSGWSENVVYNFPDQGWMGTNPHSLTQDSAGNLYGIYEFAGCCGNDYGRIYMLSPSNGSWTFTELHHGDETLDGDDLFPAIILDPQGNLWGTGSAYSGCMNTVEFGYIFELSPSPSGWLYNTPEFWSYTFFPASGALGLDSHGNLYGTTFMCGTQNAGTVWQLATQ